MEKAWFSNTGCQKTFVVDTTFRTHISTYSTMAKKQCQGQQDATVEVRFPFPAIALMQPTTNAV